MPAQLAEEWLQFEANIGARPLPPGKTIQEIRANIEKMSSGPPPVPKSSSTLDVREDIVGDRSVPIRVYAPKAGTESLPVGIFMHGGGWCLGDLDTEDATSRHIAESVPMILISVDYKLAPENKWPASLHDCVDVAKWAQRKYIKSPADVSRGIAIIGVSAGAQLAISTTAQLVSEGLPVRSVAALAPFAVPPASVSQGLKDSGKYASYTENSDGPLVSPEALNMFLDANGADPGDSSFSILFNPYLSKFPPTYIVTCGADILRDDGRLIVETLKRNSIEVKHDEYPGYPHVFWAIPGLKILDKFQANLTAGLRHVL